MKLDGSEAIKPTPFDAHEQVVRSHHAHGKDGYVGKNYKHQEYPKAVAHTEAGEPVVAKDANHEDELREAMEK